jgi:MiaB/RimO family radical SAM methylthiotransferase
MGRLSAIDGDFKIRVGMLNPEHLGRYLDGLINAMQSDRFYKFIHLPVQSGSNRVLQAMKRMYTIEQFDEYAARLRDGVPGITIETDIIVGYPTETWQDFGETLDFVERTKPNVVNMCRFWARPHAPASKLPRLPDSVITERSSALARVVRRTQQRLNDTFVGKELNVLVTEEEERSFNARADNYKKVIIKKGASNASLGLRVKARIDLASCNVLYGIPVQTLPAVI